MAAVPADLARVDLRQLRPAGPVPGRDGHRPGVVREPGQPGRPQGVPYLQFLAPALLVSTVMQGRCSRPRSPCSAGSAGSAATTRCTRRRSAVCDRVRADRLDRDPGDDGRVDLRARDPAVRRRADAGIMLAIPVGTLTRSRSRRGSPPTCRPSATRPRSTRSGGSGSRRCSCSRARSSRSTSCPSRSSWVAWLLPLWHGVGLARALSLGTVRDKPWLNLAHLVILLVLAIAGIIAMFFMYRRQLEK